MRDGQLLRPERLLSEKEQIEIERAWSPSLFPFTVSTVVLFDLLENGEKLSRRAFVRSGKHRVQKRGLVCHPYRISTIDR